MWRSYAAGTFTAKRKNASPHSLPDSSEHPPHQQQQQVRRRSSSVSSSCLEEFSIAGGDQTLKEEEAEERRRRREQQEEREEEELGAEEEEEGQRQQEQQVEDDDQAHQQQPKARSSSTFVDPTFGWSVNAPKAQQLRHSASFVPRKPSANLGNHNHNQFLLGLPPEAEQQRLKTPPVGVHKMPPVKDHAAERMAANGGSASDGRPMPGMFERDSRNERPVPEMPTTDGIEYPRAASWSSSTVAEIMRDPIGRQVFRCFLHESLAEENLLFVEEVEKMKKEKQAEKIRQGIKQLLDKYGQYINLSSVAMSKLRDATKSEVPDPKALELAHKEIYKLLENDQFPRFRRSKLYLGFLEQLLPRSYAERWMTSFDALLGNQVGRHHFRQFLFSVHAEENLRFWESVIEFRQLKNKSIAMLNMGRTIQQQFLKEGAHNEVFLPFGLRQRVEKKIRAKNVDETLFDDAVKHVEQILKNDPYVRFINSKDYNDLLAKLH